MTKLTLIFILFCAALTFTFAAIAGTAKDFDTRKYFVSPNPTTWAAAQQDCKARKLSLLSIQTEEKYSFIVKDLLDDGSLGTTYWTSGSFNTTKKVYMWEGDKIFNLHGHWGPDEVNIVPSPLFKIALSYESIYDNYITTQSYTSLHRYICEN